MTRSSTKLRFLLTENCCLEWLRFYDLLIKSSEIVFEVSNQTDYLDHPVEFFEDFEIGIGFEMVVSY